MTLNCERGFDFAIPYSDWILDTTLNTTSILDWTELDLRFVDSRNSQLTIGRLGAWETLGLPLVGLLVVGQSWWRSNG